MPVKRGSDAAEPGKAERGAGEPGARRRRSRKRTIAGLLATGLVIGVGAVVGWWRTRPPEGTPGPSDPERRRARPW